LISSFKDCFSVGDITPSSAHESNLSFASVASCYALSAATFAFAASSIAYKAFSAALSAVF
jgi:hypothetical protein